MAPHSYQDGVQGGLRAHKASRVKVVEACNETLYNDFVLDGHVGLQNRLNDTLPSMIHTSCHHTHVCLTRMPPHSTTRCGFCTSTSSSVSRHASVRFSSVLARATTDVKYTRGIGLAPGRDITIMIIFRTSCCTTILASSCHELIGWHRP